MTHKASDTVRAWIAAFNAHDVDAIAALYHEDAINHQVVQAPRVGRKAIRAMFASEFASADMSCIAENIFDSTDADGATWAILEWRDPNGLRGCGFFKVEAGKIAFQRGYFDRLTFLHKQGLPIPDDDA